MSSVSNYKISDVKSSGLLILLIISGLFFSLYCFYSELYASVPKEKENFLLVEKIAKKIAALHRLTIVNPVKLITVSTDKLLERIKTLVFLDYSKQEMIDEGRMMTRIGLFPGGIDYGRVTFELLAQQVIGLYDTQARELLLNDSISGKMLEDTAFHEVVHAIQDQNFDLKTLMKRKKVNSDAALALTAVMEGDALLIQQIFSKTYSLELTAPEEMEQLMSILTPEKSKFSKAPPVLKRSLLFPYTYGYVFMKKMFIENGFDGLIGVMKNPPRSSEQIIHPEAYLNADEPEKIHLDLPGYLQSDYKVACRDVMGEFFISVWLEAFMEKSLAVSAASGWEGDSFVFLWPSTKRIGSANLARGVFIILTKWDKGEDGSDKESREFFSALVRMIDFRWKPEIVVNEPELKIFRNFYQEWLVAYKIKSYVIYIEGLPVSVFTDPVKVAKEIISAEKL